MIASAVGDLVDQVGHRVHDPRGQEREPLGLLAGGDAGQDPGPGDLDEEREGVSSTDMDATSALGVGESISRRGEDVAKQEDELGREDIGLRGASGRPAGTSDERDSSSVDPG